MATDLQVFSNPFLGNEIQTLVRVKGVSFDEAFISELISKHFTNHSLEGAPTFRTAFDIYMREHPHAHRRKFHYNSTRYFTYFIEQFGDLRLDELRHHHITQYRDYQLARGLKPSSVRKHNNTLNAIINMAFKHLDIDKLSPFRALHIRGEAESVRPIPLITPKLINAVKERMLEDISAYRLVALIQLNTGMRISEPTLARLDDCVLNHPVPHLWVRKNALTDRKTQASIRAIPLCGVSLDAARMLYQQARKVGSEWLVPQYARDNGNTTCSATMNKCLKDLGFRSHMFRHAFVDRVKACNDIPTKLAESITGHSRGGSEFDSYGSVGYTLEQKRDVIMKVLI